MGTCFSKSNQASQQSHGDQNEQLESRRQITGSEKEKEMSGVQWSEWEDDTKTAELVLIVQSKLEALRSADAKEVREVEGIEGINWLGVELFINITGLSRQCPKPMWWVVDHICKPLCDEKKCQLIDLLRGVKVDGVPVVGRMNTFHSYTWMEPLQTTLQTLRCSIISEKDLREQYFWWDMFCQNQHIVGDVKATFDASVSQCSMVKFSLPDFGHPHAATRVWCLFEIMTAVVKRKELKVICNPLTSKGNLDDDLDIRDAQATVASDKEMILGWVEEKVEGGVDALNREVKQALTKGMTEAAVVMARAARALDAGHASETEKEEGPEKAWRHVGFMQLKKLLLAKEVELPEHQNWETLAKLAVEKGLVPPKTEVVKTSDFEERRGPVMMSKRSAIRSARGM